MLSINQGRILKFVQVAQENAGKGKQKQKRKKGKCKNEITYLSPDISRTTLNVNNLKSPVKKS